MADLVLVPGRPRHSPKDGLSVIPALGPFLLAYWAMPGQSEAICPQALSASFNLCLIDLTPG
jgi:hypothetical protein